MKYRKQTEAMNRTQRCGRRSNFELSRLGVLLTRDLAAQCCISCLKVSAPSISRVRHWNFERVIKLMFARCCTVCLKQCVTQGSVRRVSLSHEQSTLAQTVTAHTFSINVVRRCNTVRDLYRFDTFFVVVRFVSAVAEYYGPTCSWLYV